MSETIQADVVVVGGGVAGLCAAVATARAGAETVLVTDRPMLGGNCSGEIRVPMSGATHSPFSFYARESGLVEEIRNRHAAVWSGETDSIWTSLDRVYMDLVEGESHLRLFLNTVVTEVETGPDGALRSAGAVQLRSERRYRFEAPIFVDCSGDGALGALGGADFRHGREGRAEFDESLAPEQADHGTMGATLLWTTRDIGRPAPFKAPDWALDVSGLLPFREPGADPTRAVYRGASGTYHGLWWAEVCGEFDSITDDAEVCRQARRLVYGIWDWIKNRGKVDDVENQELDWIAPLPGKRESRRLMGPVILTEHDWLRQTRFEDSVGYTGWPVDIHPPGGYLDAEPGCTHVWLPGPSDIPLRSLFSRNVPNLLFAGRNLSATHVALGSPRVIATTGVMGQAVGEAAALCARERIVPGEIGHTPDCARLHELQRRLLRNDQALYGRALEDSDDLACAATVQASSTRTFDMREGDCVIPLDPDGLPGLAVEAVDMNISPWFTASHGMLAVLPAPGVVDTVAFRFAGAGRRVHVAVYTTDRPGNYRLDRKRFERSADVDADGWAEFEIGVDPGEGQVFLFHFPPQKDLGAWVSRQPLTGAVAARLWYKPGPALRDLEPSHRVLTPCFRMRPAPDLLAPGCVIDGHIRPCGLPHQWSSGPLRPDRPEWVALDWKAPVTAGRVEVVFDSGLQGRYEKIAPELVRDYTLTGIEPDGSQRILADVRDNALRLRTHSFDSIPLRTLRLSAHRIWGAPFAALFALRVYRDAGLAGARPSTENGCFP